MAEMKFQLNLFFRELLLFMGTLCLGVFCAFEILKSKSIVVPQAQFNWSDLMGIAIFAAILYFARNKKNFISQVYRVFLVLIIFTGSEIIFGIFFVPPYDILLSFVLLLCIYAFKNVAMHNLSIVFGIAGIGTIIGLGISPSTAVILLAILSFYDILAIYKTNHMIKMAKGMIESGAIFGFIVPPGFREFMASSKDAQANVGNQFMILGSGDIGLPLIVVSSLVRVSVITATITGLFSLAGLFLTHLIFINQEKRQPMAALPPIATMTIIGYLVTIIIR